MDETGLLGVADRLVEGQTRKTDITTDAVGSPPGMRALGTEAAGRRTPPRDSRFGSPLELSRVHCVPPELVVKSRRAKHQAAPHRMPVALDEAQLNDWMRGTPDYAAETMKPYAAEIEA